MVNSFKLREKLMKKIICLALCLVILASTLVGCDEITNLISKNSKDIRVSDYIIFTGNEDDTNVTTSFDREQFYLDNIDKIVFKDESTEKAFNALYGEDMDPIDYIHSRVFLAFKVVETELYNGNKVSVSWNIDYDSIDKYFDVNIVADEEVVVKGLNGRYESINHMPPDLYDLAQEKRDKYLESNNIWSSKNAQSLTLKDIYYTNDYSLYIMYVGKTKSGAKCYGQVIISNVAYSADDSTKAIHSLATIDVDSTEFKLNPTIIIDHIDVSNKNDNTSGDDDKVMG